MKIQAMLVIVGSLAAPAGAQTLLRTVNGVVSEKLGGAVIRAGDQNNDGFEDLLVGAPGSNAGRGKIYCVSGGFLATGSGTVMLWFSSPATLAPGDAFGTSLAMMGQVVGSPAPDFLVGAPGGAAVYLVDGATHLAGQKWAVQPLTNLGAAVVAVGDIDSDGIPDAAMNATQPPNGEGVLMWVSGSDLTTNNSNFHAIIAEPGIGTALSCCDIDGDGKVELVVGSPLFGPSEEGRVVIMAPKTLTTLAEYGGVVPGEHLGQSVDCAHDFNGDGKLDPVVGAPDWQGPAGNQGGRVVVLSGAKLLAKTFPVELFNALSGQVNPTKVTSWRFGASVRSSPDVNNDGVADIAVGMPGFFTTTFPNAPNRGGAVVLSGVTGARLGRLTGAANDSLGEAVLGGFQDLDGDGFAEFVVAGPECDNPTTDCGTVRCYRIFPFFPPSAYCTAKVNSLGCTPAIGASGAPSASSPAPFLVTCANLVNKKSGVMLYSHKPGATAFQGAFLCLKTPIKRVGAQSSGGSQTGSDCTGTFSFDFAAQIQSGADPTLVVGAEVFCQFWSRDPQSPSGTSLSNALRFAINP